MAQNYNQELADSVHKMFADGKTDPNAYEIAEFHFAGKAVGGEIIDGIRKRLPKISRLVEENYEHPVCVVNEKYYTLFRDKPPTTDADARKCLPLGYGVRSMGIRLSKGNDDLIYEAAVRQGLATGSAKVKKGFERTIKAVEGHRMPESRAARLISDTRKGATPRRVAKLDKIAKALPAEEGH